MKLALLYYYFFIRPKVSLLPGRYSVIVILNLAVHWVNSTSKRLRFCAFIVKIVWEKISASCFMLTGRINDDLVS